MDMGLFDKFKKKPVENATSPALIDMLSRYIGPARQRQLAFGEQVVQERNWNVDLSRGVISFGEDEYPIQLLGTESDSAGTWLWGFANPSGFPDAVLQDSEYTYNFCKSAPELALIEPALTELVNGHNIASISAAACKDRVCYYRCPYDAGAAFVLVRNVPESVFAPLDAMGVINMISELILQFPLNQKTLVKSMMEINCDEIDEAENKFTGQYTDGTSLTVTFDSQGRIGSMDTIAADQVHITLYTVIGDFDRVKKALTDQFADMTKEIRDKEPVQRGIEDLIIRFHDDTEIELHINTDRELIDKHITGMYNFFAQVECENAKLHQSVLHQIRVFNCLVGSSFVPDGNEKRTNYIINTMFAAAKDITGLVLMQDMRLFSSDGKLVFSTAGKSDFDEYIPVGNADFLDRGAEETPLDMARRERSIAVMKEKGIPYIAHLRAAVMESEARLRSPEEIAQRLLVMFAVCVYCEARNGGESWAEAQKYLDRTNEILGGRLEQFLTPAEKAFLDVREPEQQELARFSWRYECCHVLMWALGILDELGYPEQICNVSVMAKILWKQERLERFFESAKPRARDEILDGADLLLRYDWACVDARIHKRASPGGLDDGVVVEWHYAFNWLIGANGGAGWDDISTDT